MAPRLNRFSLGVLVAIATMLALLGSEPGAAAAGLDRKGTAEAKKATQLYKQGSYEEAAAIFLQLSLDNPGMPVFVRDLGACYYYLRRPEPALSNLREYLHKNRDIEPDDRAEVEGWIAEMDQLRQREATAAPAATPVAVPVAPATPSPPVFAPAPPVATPSPTILPSSAASPGFGPADTIAQVPQPADAGRGSGRRAAAWVLGGVGVAALATGGVFSYLASTNFSDIEHKYDPGKESRGKTYATLQWVGYGVGGAAIATAAILFATGADAPKSVVLAPAVGPGLAGATLGGRF